MSDELDDEARGVANGIAFLVLSDAFLELAKAHTDLDPEGGARLLARLQRRVVTTLTRIVTARPDMARDDVAGAAALMLRTVLWEAQGLSDDEEA